MYYDKENVFQKIIRGEIPCKKVHESKHSLAFYDVNPSARVHILVVPKGNYENITDFIKNAPKDEQSDFWDVVYSVANDVCNCNNFRLVANTGKGAGQSVPHFHVHILAE